MERTKKLNTVLLTLILTSVLIQGVAAKNHAENMQTFYQEEFLGLEIKISATREAEPGENITVTIRVRCTAENVEVDYLYLNFSGFRDGQEKMSLRNIMYIHEKVSLVSGQVLENNYTIYMPENVWGIIYGELSFKQSEGVLSIEIPHIGFTMTRVENVLLERLEEQLENLNKAYEQLNENYMKLNKTCNELNESYTQVNERLQSLQQNYTQLNETYVALNETYWNMKGSVGELQTTRNTMFIFLATTVIFIATTVYLLVLRKPKRYI